MLVHREVGAAEFPHLRLLDPPAELVHEQLHPVADAEHRDPELQQAALQARGIRRVHRRGATGEDDPAGTARGDLLQRHVVGHQFREHPALPHPPRDQLRVLTAVVDDHHRIHCGGLRQPLLDHGGRYRGWLTH